MKELTKPPIFFIGTGRSGSTLIFEICSKHSDVGFLTNYTDKFSKSLWINILVRFSSFNNKTQIENLNNVKERFFKKVSPKTSESYKFWNLITETNFSKQYLLNEDASDRITRKVTRKVKKLLLIQGKKVFSTKITGPGRVHYLNSIFPDAIFINIIRDGRSVTHSFLNVGFWKHRHNEPWWEGGFLDEDFQTWNINGKDPKVLTALQWKRIIETTREEASKLINKDKRYLEVKYEDFVQNPHNTISSILSFCNLKEDERVHKYIDFLRINNTLNLKYLKDWDKETINSLSEVMQPTLSKLGY